MAVRLSALRAGRPYPPGRFLVLISVRGLVDPRAIVWLEGLGQLKKGTSTKGPNAKCRRKLLYHADGFLCIWFSAINNDNPFSSRDNAVKIGRMKNYVQCPCTDIFRYFLQREWNDVQYYKMYIVLKIL
jgi:hypothetical protein